MEDKDKTEGCSCLMCKAHGIHLRSFLRIILLLVIIAVVFSLGVKLGELKSEFRGSYMKRGCDGGFSGRQRMMYPEGIQQSTSTPR